MTDKPKPPASRPARCFPHLVRFPARKEPKPPTREPGVAYDLPRFPMAHPIRSRVQPTKPRTDSDPS